FRNFRPDIVVTRFPTDDTQTHGHHTASAILAEEAFRAAADPKRFPEQLKFVRPLQPTRLAWNSWAAFRARMRNEKFDPTGLISLEAGGYQPLLGKSYPEIAASSRSMHKSQGFGVEIERGERKEYFKFLDGKPVENDALFGGVDTSWSRLPDAAGISDKITAILKDFDDTNPSRSVPALLEARQKIRGLGDEFWRNNKLAALDEIIGACLGLHLEAITEKPLGQPGQKLGLQVEAINRSPVALNWKSLQLMNNRPTMVGKPLPPNELVTEKLTVDLPRDLPFSQPYWLQKPGTTGTYAVSDQTLIGRPENPPPFPIRVALQIGEEQITYSVAPRFRK